MSGPEVKILTPEGGVMTVRGTVLTSDTDCFGEKIGAGGMPIFDQLRLLAQWGPLLKHLQEIASAKTTRDKARAVIAALTFAAGNTATKVDDEVLEHIESVLESPEGAAMFDWVVKTVGGKK